MAEKVSDDDMTEHNQRRASPELEAAANKAVQSPISNRTLAEFATHSGLVGLLARELREARIAKASPDMVMVSREKLESIRLFARDCIDTGHDRGALGNLYAITDLCDAMLAPAPEGTP